MSGAIRARRLEVRRTIVRFSERDRRGVTRRPGSSAELAGRRSPAAG